MDSERVPSTLDSAKHDSLDDDATDARIQERVGLSLRSDPSRQGGLLAFIPNPNPEIATALNAASINHPT